MKPKNEEKNCPSQKKNTSNIDRELLED